MPASAFWLTALIKSLRVKVDTNNYRLINSEDMNISKMKTRNLTVWLSLFALAAIFPAFGVFAQRKTKAPPKTSLTKPLPNLMLNTTRGQKWSLDENRGRILLINFWATWCAPCREEIPALVRLSDEYKASGLEVVGVNVDSENTTQVNNFIKEFKIDYSVLLTVPGSALSRQKAVPMTLLVNEEGVLAKKYVGAEKKSVFEKDIKDLIAEKSARTLRQPKRQTRRISQTEP